MMDLENDIDVQLSLDSYNNSIKNLKRRRHRALQKESVKMEDLIKENERLKSLNNELQLKIDRGDVFLYDVSNADQEAMDMRLKLFTSIDDFTSDKLEQERSNKLYRMMLDVLVQFIDQVVLKEDLKNKRAERDVSDRVLERAYLIPRKKDEFNDNKFNRARAKLSSRLESFLDFAIRRCLPVKDKISKEVYSFIRENYYTALKLCVHMDLKLVSLSALAGFRQMQLDQMKSDPNLISISISIIPSPRTISRMNRILEAIAESNFGGGVGGGGRSMEFDWDAILRAIIDTKKENVDFHGFVITLTWFSDGTNLGNSRNICLGGFNTCLPSTENGQSRKNCHVVVAFCGSETKENVRKYLGPFYSWIVMRRAAGFNYLDVHWHCDFRFGGDMKIINEATDRGSGSGVYPCFCCMTRKENFGLRHSWLCCFCEKYNRETKFCYHANRERGLSGLDIIGQVQITWRNPASFFTEGDIDKGLLKTVKASKSFLVVAYDYNPVLIESIQSMNRDEIIAMRENWENQYTVQLTGDRSIHDISYAAIEALLRLRYAQCDFSTLQASCSAEIQAMNDDELDLEGMLRSHLHCCLKAERTANLTSMVEAELNRGIVNNVTLFVPDLMHMNQRIKGKLLRLILVKIILQRPDLTSEQKKLRIEEISFAINHSILNSPDGVEGHFRLETKEVSKSSSAAKSVTLESIKMGSDRLNKVFDNIDIILVVCFTKEEMEKEGGDYELIKRIAEGMNLLLKDIRQQHKIWKAEDCLALQNKIDAIQQLFLEVWDASNITNYLHLLFAGHIRDYLLELGSLWMFQCQGWEALNSQIKQYIWRRTQRGGACGFKKGSSEPIMKAVHRFASRTLLYYLHPDIDVLQGVVDKYKKDKKLKDVIPPNDLTDTDYDLNAT